MTMHKVLHPRDNVNRLYVSRKEGGRRLASIGDSVDASIQRLEDYIEKYEGGLITAVRNDTDNTMANRMTITRKRRCPWCNVYRHRKWTQCGVMVIVVGNGHGDTSSNPGRN